MCLGRWFQADGASIENKLSVKRPVAVLGPGRGGGASGPHFLSSPQFFHRLLIIAPHSELGGPAPRVFWLESPLEATVGV